jgi:hypothetical protein
MENPNNMHDHAPKQSTQKILTRQTDARDRQRAFRLAHHTDPKFVFIRIAHHYSQVKSSAN